MGINWDNVVIATTGITNSIVVGKVDKAGRLFTDKSGDKTNQAVTAVFNHMKVEYQRRKKDDPKILNLEYIFEDGSKLVYEPPSEVKEDEVDEQASAD